jgi:dTDP-4-amino-4,6-dideoxygalactose transaminase
MEPDGGLRRVPLLDLGRQYESIRADVLEALERVCDAQRFILGPEVERFEAEVAGFTGARFAAGCASGTDALWLALLACGVQPGDEVVTTGFSFFASASAIVRAGARPLLEDIDPRTFNLDPARVAERITGRRTGRLRALLPVHLYGQCADMDALRSLAAEHNLALIEDAAQAFGAAWKGKRAGALGDAAAFSFYPTKNLSAFGDGGCVTTSGERTAGRLRRLRNHGSDRRYHHQEFGGNSRLDELQAAVLQVKLRHLNRWNAERRARAAAYDRLFAAAGLAGGDSAPIALPQAAAQAHHVFHQYVIRSSRRDVLREHLTRCGVGTEIYYPVPLHLQPCFSYLGYGEGSLPEAERAAREVLALPMFPELTEEEQGYVVDSIAAFYR